MNKKNVLPKSKSTTKYKTKYNAKSNAKSNFKPTSSSVSSTPHTMTILKYLQSHGYPRRDIVEYLTAGHVAVNGKTVAERNKILKDTDTVTLHLPIRKITQKGKKRTIPAKKKSRIVGKYEEERSEIILLNKPLGFVVSKSDPHNKTVYQLLPGEYDKKWYYIGRLDKDSRGLVLFTNKSEIVNKYSHPSFEVEKEYLVKTNHKFRLADVAEVKEGVSEGGDILKVKRIAEDKQHRGNWLRIVLTEGKNRHIRRMMDALGYRVVDLLRIREGEYKLQGIRPGKRIKVGGGKV